MTKWSDTDFSFDADHSVVLSDGTKIFRHGIGTSSAIWQAHLMLSQRSQGDVLEVADRRGDEVEAGGEDFAVALGAHG